MPDEQNPDQTNPNPSQKPGEVQVPKDPPDLAPPPVPETPDQSAPKSPVAQEPTPTNAPSPEPLPTPAVPTTQPKPVPPPTPVSMPTPEPPAVTTPETPNPSTETPAPTPETVVPTPPAPTPTNDDSVGPPWLRSDKDSGQTTPPTEPQNLAPAVTQEVTSPPPPWQRQAPEQPTPQPQNVDATSVNKSGGFPVIIFVASLPVYDAGLFFLDTFV